MDVLCTDKIGTLTQDRIILKRHLDIRGDESDDVLRYAFLNSHFQSGLRNLLDEAVLAHVQLHGELRTENYIKVDELPFDFSRRRMSVVVIRPDGRHLLICKGAVEEIFAVCTRYSLPRSSWVPWASFSHSTGRGPPWALRLCRCYIGHCSW